jgi:rhamnosyltransferase subunit B
MHVVLSSLGSAGDVLPFVALGRALRERGHEVVLLANERFRNIVDGAGLDFSPLGTRELYAAILDHPDLWHPARSGSYLLDRFIEYTPLTFEALMGCGRPGKSLLVSSPTVFGALIAREKLGVPLVTLNLAPSYILSFEGPMVTAGLKRVRWIPGWFRRALVRFTLERRMRRPIERVRENAGLAAVGTSMLAWWSQSPDRVVGLFPDWFQSRKRDWPPQTRVTAFAPDGPSFSTPPELPEFLAAGAPPVVFTAGTANKQAGEFFSVAAGAASRGGFRAVFLTPYPEQVPSDLPPGVVRYDHAPLSQLLPRSAALVHHGGIGTLAQALAAGIPQVIVPFALDQPENAWRLHELGAGTYLARAAMDERTLAGKIDLVLNDASYRATARAFAERMKGENAFDQVTKILEELAGPLS